VIDHIITGLVLAASLFGAMFYLEALAWIVVGVTATLLVQWCRDYSTRRRSRLVLPRATARRLPAHKHTTGRGSGQVSRMGERQAIRVYAVIDAQCHEVRA
jgi:hypothetical protein